MIFKCEDCKIKFEKQRPTTCRDGCHRCTNCQNYIKHFKYTHTVNGKAKHRAGLARYRKTDKGKVVRNKWQRKYYWKHLAWSRLKKRAWQHGLKAIDLLKLFDKQPQCQMCGINKRLSIDHMIPQHRGGSSKISNLQTLCLKCNVWKSDKIFLADGKSYLVGENHGRT